MSREYRYLIESTEDIPKALEGARSAGITPDYYNSTFLLRGQRGRPIYVDSSLKGLYVVTQGPAPVLSAGGTTIIAEKSATVYATGHAVIDARDSATVYAYDHALIDACGEAVVYDEVDVNVFDDAEVFLPPSGTPGSGAYINQPDDSGRVIRPGLPTRN